MKIKSIVLTAALATAFSAFSGSVDVDWFTTNVTSVVKYFDRNINDPVVVTNSFRAPSISFSGYAITAHVTNLVVFAEKPDVDDLKTGAKGAICAAYDSSTTLNKWYGLSNAVEWVELTTTTAPSEGDDYKFRMEFSASNSTVKYNVSTISGDTPVATSGALTRSGDANFVTNLCAFAGMGGCTNIVGEVFIDVPVNSAGVVVEDANDIPVGRIIIDTTKLAAGEANYPGANGLKNWVNYVLGIDNPTATSKPYAAPVQNSDPSVLTFELGGVDAEKVLGQSVTGAKVTYTVEKCNSTSGTWISAVDTKAEAEYKEPSYSFNKIAVPSGVQYYRIKIKIDPAH